MMRVIDSKADAVSLFIGILSATVSAIAATAILSVDDMRYGVFFSFFALLGFSLLFVKEKLSLLRNLLIFAISLRVLNVNLGKRFPILETAFPTLNISEILLVVTATALVVRWAMTGVRIVFPDGPEHKLFLALVLVFVGSLVFISPDPEFGFDRVLVVGEMYILYLVVFNLCSTERDIVSILRVLVATVLFQTILVAVEIILGDASPVFRFAAGDAIAQVGAEGVVAGRRIAGSFGDSVVFGWVMSFLFFLLLPFVVVHNPRLVLRRGLLIGGTLAVFSFGVLTMTRTSLVGQLILAPCGIYLLSRYENPRLWRWIPRLFALLAVFLLVIFLIPGASDIFSERSSDVSEIEHSIELRIISWNVGSRVLQDFPLFGMGVGTGSVLAYASQQLDPYIADRLEQERISYAGIHNGHAIMFAEMGIIGYCVYLGVMVSFLLKAFNLLRRKSNLLVSQVAVGAIMAIGYLIFSDFIGVSLAFRPAMFYVALSLALVSCAVDNRFHHVTASVS